MVFLLDLLQSLRENKRSVISAIAMMRNLPKQVVSGHDWASAGASMLASKYPEGIRKATGLATDSQSLMPGLDEQLQAGRVQALFLCHAPPRQTHAGLK